MFWHTKTCSLYYNPTYMSSSAIFTWFSVYLRFTIILHPSSAGSTVRTVPKIVDIRDFGHVVSEKLLALPKGYRTAKWNDNTVKKCI